MNAMQGNTAAAAIARLPAKAAEAGGGGKTVAAMLGALLPVLDTELTGIVEDLSRVRDTVRLVRTLAEPPEPESGP